ncbi:DUF971 domain-containing protein [Metapseudomonas furukawaii]|uniref:Gamma-butyrobetaine hydroxylase-like N-terminal domain-containing protein n=1 Tax=Metapseudomonas furukawaii TaxID=1149133 RepID=A0AAD1FFI1_METFU|nr:gamma-butyrobetaine hydroxylase-like domain-containing protein [Pseudomonas furukawaii]ELS24132.1 Hypothetical protein ppKF707_4705 [Pseudomonas furukawaii]BAU74950.1 hypothetical protein co-occurring with HEAT repeat protein [Pseudomonas furukawaii]
MNVPSALRSAADQLRLEWPDGQVTELSHIRLRAACPCSQCRAARLQGRIDTAPSEVRLRAINPQGYGVQLVFSDGHDRGIYPWSYLRGLA